MKEKRLLIVPDKNAEGIVASYIIIQHAFKNIVVCGGKWILLEWSEFQLPLLHIANFSSFIHYGEKNECTVWYRK